MKHLFYTLNPDADVARYAVRNPVYFRGIESGFAHVVIDGDWPEVVAAYKAAGIDAEVLKPETPKQSKSTKPDAKQKD